MAIADFLSSFVLGLLTPLTAVCVLPLYPAFLAYLSSRVSTDDTKKRIFGLGLLIVIGVILFMFLLGLLFTTIFQISLTNVIGIVSPIAFSILGIIGILLIFNVNLEKLIPKIKTPKAKNPYKEGFLFGFFFGAIVIPCNPAFIAVFLARSALFTNFVDSMSNFLFFGLGIGFPLLILSLVSAKWSQSIIGFLTKNKRVINTVAGLILLGISIYYLFFVFEII